MFVNCFSVRNDRNERLENFVTDWELLESFQSLNRLKHDK